MLNEVTDDAVVKVVHLGPRYALAKGDISHRSKSQRTSKVLARPRLPLTHCKKDFRKACHSGTTSVGFSLQPTPPRLVVNSCVCLGEWADTQEKPEHL